MTTNRGRQFEPVPGEPNLIKTVLPSGLTVLTKERKDSDTVAVAITVLAGSRDEDDTTSGGSHWLEHAHFLGTGSRPNNQAVFGGIEGVGGDLNATTSWELTDYFAAVPAECAGAAIDVLSDMLLGSLFPEDAFERERQVVFEELNMRANTPGTLASDTFYSTVFRTHPARRLIGGTTDTVRSIPLSTILSYRDDRYVTGNMVVSVVGRIGNDVAVEAIDTAFSRLPRGQRTVRPRVVEPSPSEPRDVRLSQGDKQAHVMFGGLAPSLSYPDYEAYIVVDSILDRTGRRLAKEIRDTRGLANAVGAEYYGLTDVAAWATSALTKPEHVEQVLELMRQQLRRIQSEPVTAAEIADAVRSMKGGRALAEERNLGQARRFARETLLDIFVPVEEWRRRLDLVRPEDVQRVAQRCFDLDHPTTVIVTS